MTDLEEFVPEPFVGEPGCQKWLVPQSRPELPHNESKAISRRSEACSAKEEMVGRSDERTTVGILEMRASLVELLPPWERNPPTAGCRRSSIWGTKGAM